MNMRLLSVLFVIGVAGCGSGDNGPAGPPLFPVEGKLTVKGEPVAGVNVQLIPLDPKAATKSSTGTLTSSGMTDAEGSFKLTASNGKSGVALGSYKVVLGYTPQLTQEEQAKMSMRKGPPKIEYPFPKEYAQSASSPKQVEITNKNPPLQLEL
jgi:hypothetical protein